MEDRYVMLKIKPDMGSGAPVVIHGVLDGHGGEVRLLALMSNFKLVIDPCLHFMKKNIHERCNLGEASQATTFEPTSKT